MSSFNSYFFLKLGLCCKKIFYRCCGGVSANDFVCETVSTLINRPLQRIREQNFASARGIAMMAGLTAGYISFEYYSSFIVFQVLYLLTEISFRTMESRKSTRNGLCRKNF